MADDPPVNSEESYEPTPVPTYFAPGEWEASVELRLKRVTYIAYADGAIAVGAIALGFLAFKGLTNLAKGLGQLGQQSQALSQAVFGNPAVVNVPPSKEPGIDETIVGTEEYEAQGNPVAEPVDRGPVEVPQELRDQIEADPLQPRDLGKGPEL